MTVFIAYVMRLALQLTLALCCLSSSLLAVQIEWQDLAAGFKQNMTKFYDQSFQVEWTVRSERSAEFAELAPGYLRGLQKRIDSTTDENQKRLLSSVSNLFRKNPLEKPEGRFALQYCDRGLRIWKTGNEDSVWEFLPEVNNVAENAGFPLTTVTVDSTQDFFFGFGANNPQSHLTIFPYASHSTKSIMPDVASPFPRPPRFQKRMTDCFNCELDFIFGALNSDSGWTPGSLVTIEMVGDIAQITIQEEPHVLVYKGQSLKRGMLIYIEIDTTRGFLPIVIKKSPILKLGDKLADQLAKSWWATEITIGIESAENGSFYPRTLTEKSFFALQPVDKFADFLTQVPPLERPFIQSSKTIDELGRSVLRETRFIEIGNLAHWDPVDLEKFFSHDQLPDVDEYYDARSGEIALSSDRQDAVAIDLDAVPIGTQKSESRLLFERPWLFWLGVLLFGIALLFLGSKRKSTILNSKK